MIAGDARLLWYEQTYQEVPAHDEWLSVAERQQLATFTFAKRRSDWRLGRWTAKGAVARYLHWPPSRLSEIEVRCDCTGAPYVAVPDRQPPPEISLSHSTETALCVVGAPGRNIGCDIESLEVRTLGFMETFFTCSERAALTRLRAAKNMLAANLIWSCKETYLKSTHEGLTRDTRDAEVLLPHGFSDLSSGELLQWMPIQVMVRNQSHQMFWFADERLVRTVYCGSPGTDPIRPSQHPPLGAGHFS